MLPWLISIPPPSLLMLFVDGRFSSPKNFFEVEPPGVRPFFCLPHTNSGYCIEKPHFAHDLLQFYVLCFPIIYASLQTLENNT